MEVGTDAALAGGGPRCSDTGPERGAAAWLTDAPVARRMAGAVIAGLGCVLPSGTRSSGTRDRFADAAEDDGTIGRLLIETRGVDRYTTGFARRGANLFEPSSAPPQPRATARCGSPPACGEMERPEKEEGRNSYPSTAEEITRPG